MAIPLRILNFEAHSSMPNSAATKTLERFFKEDVRALTRQLEAIASEISPNDPPTCDAIFRRVSGALADARAACSSVEAELTGDTEQLLNAQSQYRELIAPWFRTSAMMSHALVKPYGYPGDFEMLQAIYQGEARSRGIGGYLDRYFMATALGRAVIIRMQDARQFLVDAIRRREGNLRILNVACGAAEEFASSDLMPLAEGVEITCLDQEPAALEHVRKQFGGPRFHTIRHNALKLSRPSRFIEEHGRFDIVYSVGLCDYIPDRLLSPMLAGWAELVAPGGQLYVAFKDGEEYDKTDYQWLVDWYFLQRTADECGALFENAVKDRGQVTMTRDTTKTILNFVAKMSPSPTRRLDQPHAQNTPMHLQQPSDASASEITENA